MKKYLVYLMMVLSAFTFNACGNDDPIMEEPGTEQPETPGDSTDNPDDPANPDEPSGDSNILIAYFTRTNNTGTVAHAIADLTGGTLYRIETVVPYPEDYTECTEVAIWSFLESEEYNFTGKTVIPFCTYASTGRDATLQRIVALTPDSEHLEGFGTSGRNINGVEAWLRKIGIIK